MCTVWEGSSPKAEGVSDGVMRGGCLPERLEKGGPLADC
jgi:hypothetical protein